MLAQTPPPTPQHPARQTRRPRHHSDNAVVVMVVVVVVVMWVMVAVVVAVVVVVAVEEEMVPVVVEERSIVMVVVVVVEEEMVPVLVEERSIVMVVVVVVMVMETVAAMGGVVVGRSTCPNNQGGKRTGCVGTLRAGISRVRQEKREEGRGTEGREAWREEGRVVCRGPIVTFASQRAGAGGRVEGTAGGTWWDTAAPRQLILTSLEATGTQAVPVPPDPKERRSAHPPPQHRRLLYARRCPAATLAVTWTHPSYTHF
ncbi:hypothetical protein E2C01_001041 [Portunus trituberculatus]|uniref:Uncharacterized protein n=1 Tax=Portunus trituberculatus TaxID=210409 RepID=A0A5B7CIC9_PORTR|nr:hypothetical protein [Portunus trituberculatus]